MGAATQERPDTETDEQRVERENREQAERLAAERQEALDDGASFDDADRVADGQTGAKQVDAPPEELLVAGTTQLELIKGFGGKKATGSTISIQGVGGIPVMQGQAFEKGQYVRFEGVGLIESAEHKDKVDRKAGVAVDSKYAFKAFASDVRVFPASGPRLPDDANLGERVSTALELLRSEEPDVETIAQLLEQGMDA